MCKLIIFQLTKDSLFYLPPHLTHLHPKPAHFQPSISCFSTLYTLSTWCADRQFNLHQSQVIQLAIAKETMCVLNYTIQVLILHYFTLSFRLTNCPVISTIVGFALIQSLDLSVTIKSVITSSVLMHLLLFLCFI